MKHNLFKKLLSLILLLPAFMFAGCDLLTIKPSDEYSGTTPDKTHTTSGDPFLGAYVIVDPGSDAMFDDAYTGRQQTFAQLIDRQFNVLSEEITYRLLAVYGDETAERLEEKEITFAEEYVLDVPKANIITDSSAAGNLIDANNINTWSYINSFITGTGDIVPNAFKTQNAILGGNKFVITESQGEATGGFSTEVNTERKWLVNATNIKASLELAMLKAVSGINDNKQNCINAIDHLGFTENDINNIIKAIYKDVIGENNIAEDEINKQNLISTIANIGGTDLIIPDNYMAVVEDRQETSANEQEVWRTSHEYKAYTLLVTSIIESAIANGQVSVSTNVYSDLPRANVLFMDIYTLQGTSKEEVEDAENGDIDYDYETDAEVPPLEKYLDDLRIISIILIPNQVTSSPNMFVNGELVADESIKLDGFILGSIDFALSGEDGYNSTLYADIEIMAKGNKITQSGEENFKSDNVELYGSKIPENDDESNYNVYIDLLPEEYTKTNGEISKESMLIGGYNGNKIEDYGFSYQNLKTANNGDYKLYTLTTGSDFMGYDNSGLTFNGGTNYVKVDFIFTEIFLQSDINKENNIVNKKLNTLLNILAFNPEVC